MHIAINLLYLLPGIVGGTQTYAEELLAALAAIDTQNRYTLFLNRESAELPLPSGPAFQRVVCPVHATSRAARYQYEQIVLSRELRARDCDLVHSLGYVGPLATHCKHVVTIHDLNYLAFKQAMSLHKRLLLGFFVRQTARRADHIIAVSAFSRDEIVKHLKIEPTKISVVHEAEKSRSRDLLDADGAEAILAKYDLNGPYLIAFSSLSLNKNIPRLIEAYAEIAANFPHRLVLLGHIPPEADLRQQVARLGLTERVRFTGYAPDAHVLALLQHADLFVFPSWYEGFGLPALEAQRLGVPVACSYTASLPEVVGDAAVFFDPHNVTAIARTLSACLQDKEMRTELSQKGRTNANRFSWHQAAKQTLDIYHDIVS